MGRASNRLLSYRGEGFAFSMILRAIPSEVFNSSQGYPWRQGRRREPKQSNKCSKMNSPNDNIHTASGIVQKKKGARSGFRQRGPFEK